MKNIAAAAVLVTLMTGSASAMSKEGCGGECVSCHPLSVKEANALVKDLGGRVVKVNFPAMRGVWELDMEKDGKKAVAYLDYGKKHLIPGPIFNLATKKAIAADAAPQPPAVTKINPGLLTPGNSIVLGNMQGKKRLYVFTDPDCPYCAKLHGELKKLVAMDPAVAVYIKLFPLKMHPQAYDKSRVILQGPSAKLLDDAFAKVKLPAPGPQTPTKGVDENIRLAQKLGINSTPTMVFSDGRVVAGAKTAAEILTLINGKKK